MTVIDSDFIVMVDVDDTLVKWSSSYNIPHDKAIQITDQTNNSIVYVTPHEKHINLLKKYKDMNYKVFVWSGGGYRWAKSVIETLQLQNHVDFIMTKPIKYIDDLDCNEWMGSRIYLKDYGDK